MKKTVILLSTLALLTSSCGQTTKEQAKSYSTPSWADSTFYSDIRPNESLQLGTLYTDSFEYIGYNDDGDEFLIDVIKDDKIHGLINDDIHIVSDLNLNRGDMVKIQWQIDSLRPAGDEEMLWFEEYAVKITKTKDGNVSLFKKIYPKPIKYYSESDYSDSFLDKIYRNVEYYLANSKQDLVKLAINNPKNSLIYSIEEREMDNINYCVVGVYNEFENTHSIIQWIYMSLDFQKIFEYDLPNDELIEFK